jgi:hypothetical protein
MPAKLNLCMRRILLSGCLISSLTVFYLYVVKSCGYFEDFDAGAMRLFPTSKQAVLGWLGMAAVGVMGVKAQGDFNAPPGVDTWCGKAYRAT